MMYCTQIRNQNNIIFISLKTSDFKGKEEISDYIFQGFYYYFSNFLLGYHLNLTNALHPRLGSDPGSWETWFQCSVSFENCSPKHEVRDGYAALIPCSFVQTLKL